ncbi:MAG TPA: type I-D CRISPR-associated helicase Cas3' [Chroococcales cyanobacterium]|jgi:CRISPR-associated endonuclease/helicase Cas3
MTSVYSITLKPIYSCPSEELPSGVKLPDGWSLSWHQVETLKALRDPAIDVVFNTAMTGDGKSLAAYLETLQGELNAIGQYPTNELARDQEMQVQDYVERFEPPGRPRIARLSGEELELYAETENLRKADAIATRTSQREILLTNPDIFHYLHRGAYLIPKQENPDKLWGRIDQRFQLFIFDEFHLFSAPQVASVINTVLLIRYTKRRKKFLFLSATPNDELLQRLKDAGLKCELIDPARQGKYQFPDTLEHCQLLEAQGWRNISREIQLYFVPLEPSSRHSEQWLKENAQIVLDYFLQHRGSKGAIILNSIAAVKRLTLFFQDLLRSHGLTVGENTGLSGKTLREESRKADLILGTSTIDVGVDFKINFLMFESADAGSFIQRLGRLGRHDGYERDGHKIPFHKFTAYALTPNFLVGRLFSEENHPFDTDGVYDRAFLNQHIRQHYRPVNDFQNYYSRWAAIQSVNLCGKQGLGNPRLQAQYAGSLETFKATTEKIFGTTFNRVAGCLRRWRENWKVISGKDGNPIAQEASSFRGSSPLQFGILDLTEPNLGEQFKTYDLPGILSNLDIEMMTKAEFQRQLEATIARTGQPIAKGRFEYCLGFIKLHGYREERLDWRFTYPAEVLQAAANAYQVQVLLGVQVWQPQNRWIEQINQRLGKQALVSYVLRCPVIEARRRLQLPMHFPLYPIDEAGRRDRDAQYAIAFGQAALLLETVAYRIKSKGEEVWIC